VAYEFDVITLSYIAIRYSHDSAKNALCDVSADLAGHPLCAVSQRE